MVYVVFSAILDETIFCISGRAFDGRLSHRSDGKSLTDPFQVENNSISLKLPTIYVFGGFKQLRVQQTLRKPRIQSFS